MKAIKDFIKIFLGSLPKRKNKAQSAKLYHGYLSSNRDQYLWSNPHQLLIKF